MSILTSTRKSVKLAPSISAKVSTADLIQHGQQVAQDRIDAALASGQDCEIDWIVYRGDASYLPASTPAAVASSKSIRTHNFHNFGKCELTYDCSTYTWSCHEQYPVEAMRVALTPSEHAKLFADHVDVWSAENIEAYAGTGSPTLAMLQATQNNHLQGRLVWILRDREVATDYAPPVRGGSNAFHMLPPKPETVSCFEWMHEVARDPYAPERFREIAFGLYQEDWIIGKKMPRPKMNSTEELEVAEKKARKLMQDREDELEEIYAREEAMAEAFGFDAELQGYQDEYDLRGCNRC